MVMTASIGSVPSAIGIKTLRAFEAMAVTVEEEEECEGEKNMNICDPRRYQQHLLHITFSDAVISSTTTTATTL
jgi:hypothetical protein